MDFLARVTIYISLGMGICIFTIFTLLVMPHIIDQYQDIWEDYQRSLEPEVIDEDLDEWISGSFTVTEIPIVRYDKADLVVCATLFDKLFDTYYKQSTDLMLRDRTDIIINWDGGQAFRDSDCSHFVDSWGYLATHDAWRQIDWDIVNPLDTITMEE
jgi:hypothetical protein